MVAGAVGAEHVERVPRADDAHRHPVVAREPEHRPQHALVHLPAADVVGGGGRQLDPGLGEHRLRGRAEWARRPRVGGVGDATSQPEDVRLSRTSTVVPPLRTAVPVRVLCSHTTSTLAESDRIPPYWASITRTTASSAEGVSGPASAASRAADAAGTPSAAARAVAPRTSPCPARQLPSASTRRTAAVLAAGVTSPDPGRQGTGEGRAAPTLLLAAGVAVDADGCRVPGPDGGRVASGVFVPSEQPTAAGAPGGRAQEQCAASERPRPLLVDRGTTDHDRSSDARSTTHTARIASGLRGVSTIRQASPAAAHMRGRHVRRAAVRTPLALTAPTLSSQTRRT